ncbi:hypothetical protein [Salinibacter ruber]|uniref:hypothetical protein n=1 Tax=Salinibacter ruber TaxID=146919 RepID=UPI002073BB01|nr:hypothetical protein [Salinibacter ruber]MCS4114596.1 hypothetical protein [Salinibacter ruber]MCS4181771.1 hypothetical protein [Salinibacter ruber]
MEQIREAEPPQLFVGADGPRPNHPDDAALCDEAREIATRVDWDCEVHTLFRDTNLGLKESVSSAITWFFEHVEEGIILEDDCVPHPAFFPYCEQLLERYRGDKRIMAVGGNNFQPDTRQYEGSYYFSGYMHCWGWATWRRSWECYDGEISAWGYLRDTAWLKGWLGTEMEARHWGNIFDQVAEGKIESWAYPWTFACWKEHGLTILPIVNLVSNVGFDERSTHTKDADADAANMDVERLSFPLEHPCPMTRYYEADWYTSRHHFDIDTDPSMLTRARHAIPEEVKAPIRPLVQRLRK